MKLLCTKSYFCLVSCLEVMPNFPHGTSYQRKKIETNFKKCAGTNGTHPTLYFHVSVSYIITFFPGPSMPLVR